MTTTKKDPKAVTALGGLLAVFVIPALIIGGVYVGAELFKVAVNVLAAILGAL